MTCETNRRRMLALLGTGVLGAAVSSCGHANVTPPAMGDGATTHLSLHISDAQGNALNLEALRRVQSNGTENESHRLTLAYNGLPCVSYVRSHLCSLSMS